MSSLAALESKLNLLLASAEKNEDKINFLVQSASKTEQQLAEFREAITSNKVRITTVEHHLGALEQEVKQLKGLVNIREQQGRNLAIRVIGLAMTEEERTGAEPSKATAKLVYDRVLKPMLGAAKDRNKLATLPQLSTAVTEAFRLRARSGVAPTGAPPMILVKLSSPAIKSAIFAVKKDALPAPSAAEKDSGTKRLMIVEDLTPPTFKMLKMLREDKRVARAWTVEGRIRYVLEKEDTIRTVSSVFDHLDTFLQ